MDTGSERYRRILARGILVSAFIEDNVSITIEIPYGCLPWHLNILFRIDKKLRHND